MSTGAAMSELARAFWAEHRIDLAATALAMLIIYVITGVLSGAIRRRRSHIRRLGPAAGVGPAADSTEGEA